MLPIVDFQERKKAQLYSQLQIYLFLWIKKFSWTKNS